MNLCKLTKVSGQGLCCLLAMMVICGCRSTVSEPPIPDVFDLSAPVTPPAVPATPEALEVMAALDNIERAIEEHNLAGILQQISVYYSDESNNSYPKLRLYFLDMFEDYSIIDVRRTETTVTVKGSLAEVHEQFATSATPTPDSGAPPIDETGAVTIRLRRVAGEWLVTEWDTGKKQ